MIQECWILHLLVVASLGVQHEKNRHAVVLTFKNSEPHCKLVKAWLRCRSILTKHGNGDLRMYFAFSKARFEEHCTPTCAKLTVKAK
jgi:hypothetical protein